MNSAGLKELAARLGVPIHTVHDTIDLMDAAGLAFAAEVIAAAVAHHAAEQPGGRDGDG